METAEIPSQSDCVYTVWKNFKEIMISWAELKKSVLFLHIVIVNILFLEVRIGTKLSILQHKVDILLILFVFLPSYVWNHFGNCGLSKFLLLDLKFCFIYDKSGVI